MSRSNFTISNFLSFSRILLTPLAVWLIANHYNGWALLLTFVGMYTDYLDGVFARKYNQITDLGKILDPLGDKVIIGFSVAALWYWQSFPMWLMLLIVLRDIIILAGALFIYEKVKKVTPSNWAGKVSVAGIASAGVCFLGYNAKDGDFLLVINPDIWHIIFNISIVIALSAILISTFSYLKVFLKTFKKTNR